MKPELKTQDTCWHCVYSTFWDKYEFGKCKRFSFDCIRDYDVCIYYAFKFHRHSRMYLVEPGKVSNWNCIALHRDAKRCEEVFNDQRSKEMC